MSESETKTDTRDPNVIIAEQVDRLFEASDHAAFLIMEQMVEHIQEVYNPKEKPLW